MGARAQNGGPGAENQEGNDASIDNGPYCNDEYEIQVQAGDFLPTETLSISANGY